MTERSEKLQAQKKKQQNQKADKSQLVVEYRAIAKSPALEDILKNCLAFSNYHVKLAKDGTGVKYVGKDANGDPVEEQVFYSRDERTSHLDKAAGIEEITAYINRMLDAGIPKPDEA